MRIEFYNSNLKTFLSYCTFVVGLFVSVGLSAQTIDLALGSRTDTVMASVGDTVDFTLVLYNQGNDTVTNVRVANLAPTGATIVSAVPERGIFNMGTGEWDVDSLLAGVDSLVLDLRMEITAQGVIYNQAEISLPATGDIDSTPGNSNYFEDDITSACVSVPLDLTCGNTLKLTAPVGFTGYQWYKDGNPIAGQTFDTLLVDTTGSYTFTTNEITSGCQSSLCCPVMVNEDCQFDLALRKEVAETGPFRPGDTVSYNITVYNQGTVDATGIVLTDYVPTGMLLADADWNADSTYTLGNLAAGDSVVVNVDLRIDPSFEGTLTTNNAEITSASNSMGHVDEDGDIATVDGSTDDTTELGTDNDVDDEHEGTPGTADNGADADDYDLAQITVVQEFDLALVKALAESGPFAVGDTVTFSITVYNQGTVEATNVIIKDYVSADMDFIDADWNADSTYNLGTIAAGASASVDIDLRVDPGFMGTSIINTAEITSASNSLGLIDEDGDLANVTGASDDGSELPTDNDIDDEAPGTPGTADNGADHDDYDPEQIVISQGFDLALTKVVTESGPFAAGDTVTYRIKVYNQGTVDATGVVVRDYVSADMSNVDPDWNGVDTVILGNIAAGDSAFVDIDLRINPSFQGISIINNAEITAGTNALGALDEDGDLANVTGTSDDNSELATDNDVDDEAPNTPGTVDNPADIDDYDPAQINVQQEFDLALTKVVTESGPFAAGDTVTYRIKVYNQGTVDATGVVVRDYVSSDMSNVDPDWNGVDTVILGNIAAGDSAFVDIDLRIAPSFMGTSLINNAEITAGTNALGLTDEDSDLANVTGTPDDNSELGTDNDVDDEAPNTPGTADNGADHDDYDPAQISVQQEFDLALTKIVAESGPFAPGDTVTFRITVYNQGTLDATGVQVTDYVSANMVNVDADWGGSNTYTIGNVAAGAFEFVDIDLRIAPAFAGTSLINTAEITAGTNASGTADEDDPLTNITGSADDNLELATDDDIDDEAPGTPGTADNGSDIDDYDLAQISIGQSFDLALTKIVAESGPFVPGDTVTYRITVYNQGTIDATNVAVGDYISTNMTLADPDWTGPTYALGTIAAGDSAFVDVDIQINPTFQGDSIINNAEIVNAGNSLGLTDEDSPLANQDGSQDDNSELDTDNDVDDEAPNTPGTADNASDIDDYDPAMIQVQQDFDLALRKVLAESGPFAAGDTVSFTIQVFNQGSVDATGVVIRDYVSANMDLVDATWNADSTYNVGNIAAGDSASVNIDLRIKPAFMGSSIINTAEITAGTNALGLTDEDDDLANIGGSSDDNSELATDNDLDDEASNTPGTTDNAGDVDDYDLAQFNVTQEFDLALRKELAESGPFATGDTVTYTITIYNQGSVDATGVVIRDYVSANMDLVDADWNADSTYNVGNITAGASVSVDIDLRIKPAFMGTSIINTAEITAGTNALGLTDEDDDLANVGGSSDDNSELATDDDIDDEASGTPGTADNAGDVDDYDLAEITISQGFDLALTKVVAESGPFYPGDTVTYTIKVYNQGTVDATGVIIRDYVSANMALADADWNADSTYAVGNIAAGDSASVDVDLRINTDFQGAAIINTAEITAASNGIGATDEDSDLTNVTGSSDDSSELGTDNDVDDEAPNTPGTADNPSDIDDYDPAQINVQQEFDLALTKVVAEAGPFYPGDTATYTIKVYNQGSVDATGVVIRDYVSANMDLVDADWNADSTYTVGNIAAGDSASVDVDLRIKTTYQGALLTNTAEVIVGTNALGLTDEDGDIATIDGSSDDTSELGTDDDVDDEAPNTPGTADNGSDADEYDLAQIPVQQEFDLALTKVVAEAGPFYPGDTVTYTIKVYNQGSVDATGVVIRDYVSVNMDLVDADWNADSTYTVGNIAAGDSSTVDVDLRIKTTYQGALLTNTAEVIAGTNALGLTDEDGDIATIDGSSDDTSELGTDDDVDDEAPNTPGTADNGSDADEYDLAQIPVQQEFDLALTKVVAEAGPFAAGDTVTYTIVVYNQGTVEATGVVIRDYVSANMDLVDADWNADSTYNVGTIAAGNSASVDVDLRIKPGFMGTEIFNTAEITAGTNSLGLTDEDGDIATVDGSSDDNSELATDNDIDDEAPGTPGTADNAGDIDDYDLAGISIGNDFDLALTKTLAESGPFAAGDTITFNITVYNQGTLDATGVVIEEYVPTGMDIVDTDWNADSTYNVGNLAAGTNIVVPVDLKIKDNFQGSSIVNNAEIIAASNSLGVTDEDDDIATIHGSSDDNTELPTGGDIDDEAPGTPGSADNINDVDDWDVLEVPVQQDFDLALRKTVVSSGPFAAGDTVTYRIMVYNQGSLDATGVIVGDYISADMTLADPDWGGASYSLGNIASGDSAFVDIDLRINPSFAGTELYNSAEIISGTNALGVQDEDDPLGTQHGQPDDTMTTESDDDVDDEGPGTPGTADNGSDADDYDIAIIMIGQSFDLALTKAVAEAGPFAAGDTITYTITVYNQGTVEATGVVIRDYVSANMDLVDADWNADSTYNVGTVAAGASASVDVDLRIKPTFMGASIANTAEITSATNALGLTDEDDDLANVTGASDDTSESATDDDIDDDGPGTPGTADNGSDIDDYDLAEITVSQGFDLALTKVVSESGPFIPGDTVTYTIKAYNQGTVDATGVVVTDYVSANMTLVDTDWNADSTYNVGAIAAGDSAAVDVDLRINTSFQGATIINTAEITAANNSLGAADEDSDLANVTGASDDGSELGTDNDVDDEAPNTPGTVDNINDIDDYDPAQINVQQEFDLALTKTVSEAGPFAAGDTVTYTITVYNQGTLDATGVVVRDYVPAGMDLVDADWNADSTYNLGALASGASAAVDVDLRIKTDFQGGSLTNNAEIIDGTNALGQTDEDGDLTNIDGSEDDTSEVATDDDIDDEAPGTPGTIDNPSDADDYDPAQIPVQQEFDLALTKVVAESGPFAAGDTITYTITVYNQGTLDATGVIIRDYVSANMDLVDSDWNADSTYNVGAIAAGASVSVDVDLRVKPGYMGSSIINTAEITAGTNALGLTDEDDDLANVTGASDDGSESATDDDIDDEAPGTPGIADNGSDIDDYDLAEITIGQNFDLALTKTAPAGPFNLGDTVTFTIVVSNEGTLDATNIEVTDYVPADMILADPAWGTDSTYTIGSLASGADTTLTIDLRIDPAFMGTVIENFAEITDATGGTDDDSTPDNNSTTEDDDDSAPINVNQEFDLALTKDVAEAGPFVPGDTVTYTITVYNQGTLDATGVIVRDYVPAGMDLVDADWNADSTYNLGALAAGASAAVDVDLRIKTDFQGGSLTNNAEIIDGTNALGQTDEDGDLTNIDGSEDDTSEVATDDDIDDEAPGTPGTTDNPSDADDYDPAQIPVQQEFDLALTKVVAESGPFYPGDTVTYTITVYNQGTLDATNVIIEDYVSANMTNVDTDWTGNQYAVGTVSAGTSTTVDIDLRINDNFQDTLILNTAEIISGDNALGLTDEDDDLANTTGTPDDGSELPTEGDVDDEAPGTPGTTDNPNDIDDYDVTGINVEQDFDLALTKVLAETGPFAAGDTVTFDITVYNQGSVDATNVVIEEYVPVGMELADPDWNADSTYNVGTVAAGSTSVVSVDLRISSGFMGSSLINRAEIVNAENTLGLPDEDSTPDDNEGDAPETGTPNDIDDEGPGTPGTTDNPNDEDDYDFSEIPVGQIFDLALIKTVVGAVAYNPGDTVTFQVSVINQGSLDATDVIVEDFVPTGFIFDASLNSDFVDDGSGNIVDTVASVTAGTTVNLTLALRIDPAYQGFDLVNNAEILDADNALGISDTDSNYGDNEGDAPELDEDDKVTDADTGSTVDDDADDDDFDPAQITVNQRFDLALRKTLAASQVSPVHPGDTVYFDITVFNQGTLDAYDVRIVDYVPAGMTLISGTGWAMGPNSTATMTLDQLNEGDSITVSIPLSVNGGVGSAVLTNNAEVAGAAIVDNGPDYPDTDSNNDNNPDNDGNVVDNAINDPSDEDDHDPAIINVGIFDLALRKDIAPGQNTPIALGQHVDYLITVINEGDFAAENIEVTDNIPDGMILSPFDTTGWTSVSQQEAIYTIPGTLLPGDSVTVSIRLMLIFANPGGTIVNIAEIVGASDSSGIAQVDMDSTPDNAEDEHEDDDDEEEVEVEEFDPIGYIYCEKTGRIMTGGRIEVTGPAAPIFAVDMNGDTLDGRTGKYQFFVTTPGIYNLSYSHPDFPFPMSIQCPAQPGAINPNGLDGTAIDVDGAVDGFVTLGLGLDINDANYLADTSCADNPYYLQIEAVAPPAGQTPPLLNHNNIPIRCTYISSIVCEDTNGNNVSDPGETGIADVAVELYFCNDTTTVIARDTTDALGSYEFDGLGSGQYQIKFLLPQGYKYALSNVGFDDTADSDVDQNGFSHCVTLAFGECDTTIAACLIPLAGLGDTVWYDLDQNGLQDPGEPGITNVQVDLYDADTDTLMAVTYTNASGYYEFVDLSPGDYYVVFNHNTAPTSYEPTTQDVGANGMDAADSDADPTTGRSHTVNLTAFEFDSTIDAGYILINGVVSGTAWKDCDNDGLQDVGEEPLANVEVTLTGNQTNGAFVTLTDTTDAQGNYDFTGLRVGIYRLTFGQPAGITGLDYSPQDVGTDDTIDSDVNATGMTLLFQLNTDDSLDFDAGYIDAEAPVIVPTDPFMTGLMNGDTITFSCDNIGILNLSDVTVTDNCDPNPDVREIEFILDRGNCNANGYLMLMECGWIASDACGNISRWTVFVKVTDTVAPVFANVPVDANVACDSIPAAQTLTATDNCDTDLDIVFTEVVDNTVCPYTITRTWKASDDCGNFDAVTQVITVNDDESPVITVNQPNLTIPCDSLPAYDPLEITATDNCDTDLDVSYQDTIAGTGCTYQIVRIYSATDNCGNTTTASRSFTVTDTEAPTFTNIPSDMTMDCNAAMPPVVPPVVNDDCDGGVTVSMTETSLDLPCGLELTRVWTATDQCGNTVTASQVITLIDSNGPVFSDVPADTLAECSNIPPVVNPTVKDECSGFTVAYNQTTVGSGCSYMVMREWTATDDCGNVSTATQTINVYDNTAPSIVLINPLLIGIQDGDTLTVNCDNIPSLDTVDVKATDNCDDSPTVRFFDIASTPGTCADDGYLSIMYCTWTAVDDCGNMNIFDIYVKVTDNTPPVITGLPSDLTLDCNAPIPGPGTVNASDNCSSVVDITNSDQIVGGNNCGSGYSIIRTYTATDECGNSVTATQTISLTDNTAPTITVSPQTLTVNCGDMIPNATVNANDNCDAQVDVVMTTDSTGGSCASSYVITRTFTATDDCGNSSTATQAVTVFDNEAPVILNVPGDVTVDLGLGQTIPQGLPLQANDNCDNDVQTGTPVDVQSGNGCSYTITRTWTATDDCGNSHSMTQVITVINGGPALTATSTPASCANNDGTATANVTGGATPYNFAWSNGASTQTITGLNAGTYSVTVADANGCTNTATTTVTGDAGNLNLNITSKNEVCGLSNGTISAMVTGGTLPYTYAWSNGGSTAFLSGLSAGTYMLVVTDATGCSTSATVTLIDEPGNMIVNVDTKDATCGSATGSATAMLSGGTAPYVYNWSNGATTAALFNLGAGLYTVTVTDANGCTAVATGQVFDNGSSIAVNIASTDETCGSGNGTVTATPATGSAPFSYAWSTGASTPTITGVSAGTYSVTVTDANGCSGTASTQVINVNTNIVITISSDDASCAGGDGSVSASTISGTAPYTYAWSNGGTGSSITGLDAGIYSVTITDANGCTGTATTQVNATNSNVSVTIASTDETCAGGDGTATATPGGGSAPFTYAWSTGASTSSVNNLTSGIYTVTVTDANGCTASASTQVNQGGAPIVVQVSSTEATCGVADGTATASPANGTAPFIYAWSTGSSSATATGLTPGNHSVTVTDADGCSGTATVTVLEATCPCTEPVLDKILANPASCSDDDGEIFIAMIGNDADFVYAWSPNVGMPNAAGNNRTGLPSGDYTITIMPINDTRCSLVVNYTLEMDCATSCDIFTTDFMQVESSSSSDINICLPIATGSANDYTVTVDGTVYTDPYAACGNDTLVYYQYGTIAGDGTSGPYRIISWSANGNTLNNQIVNNFDELASVMNLADPGANWTNNRTLKTLSGGLSTGTYGALMIEHLPTGSTYTYQVNITSVPYGEAVLVDGFGAHQIIIEDPNTGCLDTLDVSTILASVAPNIRDESLFVNGGNMIEESFRVVATDCAEDGLTYCIPEIAWVDIDDYKISDNGQPYTEAFGGCNFLANHSYSYFSIPEAALAGPYSLTWTVDGTDLTGTFNSPSEMTDLMNQLDAAGNWLLDTDNFSINSSTSNGKEYGNLRIVQVASAKTAILNVNTNYVATDLSLRLTEGMHEFVFERLSDGAVDTLTLAVACVASETIHNRITIGQRDTFCLDTEELLGEVVSVTNMYPEEGGPAEMARVDNSNCYVCDGMYIGTTETAFVVCDEYGICDTTYMRIDVTNGAVNIAYADTVVARKDSRVVINVSENDRMAGHLSGIRIIEEPANGTVQVNPDMTITYTPFENYCDEDGMDIFRYELCTEGADCVTAPVYVTVGCDKVVVNTGFSPNGDGTNDYFTIEGLEEFPEHEISIFNVWGAEVFYSKEYNNDWDGTSKAGSVLPSGTYFYVLKDGEGNTESGYVQIMR